MHEDRSEPAAKNGGGLLVIVENGNPARQRRGKSLEAKERARAIADPS
jgi:hypothetical protein